MTVYFLDIDDCMIVTSRLGRSELTALETALLTLKRPKAKEITAEFAQSFHRLYDRHQEKSLSGPEQAELEKYLARLKQLQSDIVARWGQIKKWSRECFIYIAAEKFSVKLNSQQVAFSSEKLWESIASHTPFYPDAKRFLHKLIAQKISFYLISSSDCRLKFDDLKNQFIYDPDYSRNLKLKRLKKLTDLGILKENLFLGDPYDKPDPWVFKKAMSKARKDISGSFNSIMIGDSPKNDLLPAQKAGMQTLIWIDRHNQPAPSLPFPMQKVASFDEL